MKKILLIHENADVRENTAELLELNHFKVLIAEAGHDGYESARKHLPDIIMCDMTIPGIKANDFLKRSMSDQFIKNIPFIFFSNGSGINGLEKYFPKENPKYLTNPFTEEDLMQVVNNILSANPDVQH